MPPQRRGAAAPPNPWTHLDAQGRHLPGVIAEAPLADDGSIDDDSMYDSDNDPGTPARAASDPGDPAPRPVVVTPDPAPVATPVPVAVAVPATPPVLPTQQLPPRNPSDGGKACVFVLRCLAGLCLLQLGLVFFMKSQVTAGLTARGYAQVPSLYAGMALHTSDLAKIRTAIHTRNAAGECPTASGSTRSGWARKDCPMPVRTPETSRVLHHLSDRLSKSIEAVTGPNPFLCEHASLTSYPGAGIQNQHPDISSGKAVSVVVYLDGVADNETAPLEVWPGSHLIDNHRSSITPVKLAPLEPGAVVIYDSRLWHRGTANDSPRARTTYWFTYCSADYKIDNTEKRLPELEDQRGMGRVRLSDVVDGNVEAKLAGVPSSDFPEYSSCVDYLYAYNNNAHGDDEADYHGLGLCPEFTLSGSERHDGLHGTYIANGTCAGRTQYKCIDCGYKSASACWVSSSAGWLVGTAGCGSSKGMLQSTDYSGQGRWMEAKGAGHGWASTYDIEVTCQCSHLPQLIHASQDVSWCLDSYLRRAERGDDKQPSVSWVQENELGSGTDADAHAVCSTVDSEANATRYPPCAWPKMTGSDAYAHATSKLFRHAVVAMNEDGSTEVGISGTLDAGCDLNLLQALTEVGIYRKDSVLWTIVEAPPLPGVPAHRLELLELARKAVIEEVKEQEKVIDQYEDILVESCFGGRALIELYVSERDQALEYGSLSEADMLAKQAWWARGCNGTAPAGGEKDGRHKRAKSVFREWLDAQEAELKRLEEEHPILMFFCRILGPFFTLAIIAAIRGVSPGQTAGGEARGLSPVVRI